MPSPIAVLAFRSVSLSGNQDYFTDAMVDELIIALSGVAGLQVAGRTFYCARPTGPRGWVGPPSLAKLAPG